MDGILNFILFMNGIGLVIGLIFIAYYFIFPKLSFEELSELTEKQISKLFNRFEFTYYMLLTTFILLALYGIFYYIGVL